jgi:hypothetical protein
VRVMEKHRIFHRLDDALALVPCSRIACQSQPRDDRGRNYEDTTVFSARFRAMFHQNSPLTDWTGFRNSRHDKRPWKTCEGR